jgi:hypothetical protein
MARFAAMVWLTEPNSRVIAFQSPDDDHGSVSATAWSTSEQLAPAALQSRR